MMVPIGNVLIRLVVHNKNFEFKFRIKRKEQRIKKAESRIVMANF